MSAQISLEQQRPLPSYNAIAYLCAGFDVVEIQKYNPNFIPDTSVTRSALFAILGATTFQETYPYLNLEEQLNLQAGAYLERKKGGIEITSPKKVPAILEQLIQIGQKLPRIKEGYDVQEGLQAELKVLNPYGSTTLRERLLRLKESEELVTALSQEATRFKAIPLTRRAGIIPINEKTTLWFDEKRYEYQGAPDFFCIYTDKLKEVLQTFPRALALDPLEYKDPVQQMTIKELVLIDRTIEDTLTRED